MDDFTKKLLKKIGFILSCLLFVVIVLFSLLLGLGSVAEVVVRIVTIAGKGSLVKGLIMAPFVVFGAVQIFRGILKIVDADIKKMETKGESIWHFLYIPLSLIGYVAFFVAISNWSGA